VEAQSLPAAGRPPLQAHGGSGAKPLWLKSFASLRMTTIFSTYYSPMALLISDYRYLKIPALDFSLSPA
jgi:hypothetical protein